MRGRKGDAVVDTDEHPRPGTTVESLAKLRPMLGANDPEATVTAGNASGQNDAAALCVVTRASGPSSSGCGRWRGWCPGGSPVCRPRPWASGRCRRRRRALDRAGLSLADIDLIELNEAFAAQVLACTREWGFGAADFERVNVHGSGISLGHPVGATGTRILATMTREMHRRGARYGLETMCIGGGQGLAAVFERVDA